MSIEPDKPVKVSVCQSCDGWVRVAVLNYFQTSTKARNEFMKEVATYNLAVKEMSYQDFQSKNKCTCK